MKKCVACGKKLGNVIVTSKDGETYHIKCYEKETGEEILGNWLSVIVRHI